MDNLIRENGIVSLRDRKRLAQDGMIVVIVNLSAEDGSMISEPDIITRGFIYARESEEIIRELKNVVVSTLSNCAESNITDAASLQGAIVTALSDRLYEKTKRCPFILPDIKIS
jgi:ribonuclease J